MNKIAQFKIEDVLEISGRGLAFAGRIVSGVISKNNYVKLKFNDKIIKREITNVEGIRHSTPSKVNVGLIIKCLNKNEIKQLKDSKEFLPIIDIYKE